MPSILIVCNSYPPEIGAAPTRIYNLAHLLRDAGYAVEVVCALPNYPTGRIHPDYRGKLRVTEVLEGITVRRLPLLPSASRKGFRRMVSMATHAASLAAFLLPHLLRRKPRLVIVSSPPLPMAAAGASVAKAVGCRVLLNVSDLWPLSALELGAVKQGRLYRALEGLEMRMYRRADAVMGQSDTILAHVAAHVTRPCFLYRNLPATAPAREDAMPHSHNSLAPHSVRRLLYAGQLGPVQGIADICEAHDFAALGIELHLYGDGPERGRIAERIAEHPACGITLHKPVPLDGLPALLAGFDGALVPLRTPLTGAVPSKLFTAVAAGLPVIFCGGGEGARVVDEHGLGWVSAPGDEGGLDHALRQFSAQPMDDARAMKLRCHDATRTTFSKPAQDAAFLKFLAEVLAG